MTAFIAVYALASVCCWVGYLLLRQQGRLLIRLEGIEQELVVWRLRHLSLTPSTSEVNDVSLDNSMSAGEQPADGDEGNPDLARMREMDPIAMKSRLNRAGLMPGTVAPDFTLEHVGAGKRLSLSEYRGKSVLLVLGSVDCSPCDTLMAELSANSSVLTRSAIVFVSRGSPELVTAKVRRFEPPFPVVRQEAWEVSRQYGTFKFPAGYLVNAEGVIAAGPEFGPEEIIKLANRLCDDAQRQHVDSSARTYVSAH